MGDLHHSGLRMPEQVYNLVHQDKYFDKNTFIGVGIAQRACFEKCDDSAGCVGIMTKPLMSFDKAEEGIRCYTVSADDARRGSWMANPGFKTYSKDDIFSKD